MSLTDDEVDKLERIIAMAAECRRRLTKWENEFLDDIEKQYDEKGGNIFLTSRQWQALERIEGKC